MGSDVTVRELSYQGKDSRAFADYAGTQRFALDRADLGEFAHFLAQLLQSQVFVAEHDKQMIGFIALARGSGPAAHAGTLRLHVSKEHRGDGVGTQLLEAALEWADANGVQRVVATPYLSDPWVEGDLGPKVSFFRKHGFDVEGIARKFARKGDRIVDAALMARVR